MKIKCYSPVIIPTLNRYEHFKRCLESLEKCTGAEYTDVYVGLDYPPSEKYVDGWKKIDEYLTNKEEKNGFLHLYVRRRDHNCGIGKSGSNGSLLVDEVRKKTDRFISSEDDNEFSPCYLEYTNKALEKYKDDKRIICVCGYTPFDSEGDDNVYFARQTHAWGVGRWIRKDIELIDFCKLESLEIVLKDFRKSMQIFRFRPILLSRVLDQVIKKRIYKDVCFSCFCVLNNIYSLFPSQSLVRNWGNDGTGVHCKKVNDTSFVEREISQTTSFELDDVDVFERREITKRLRKVASKNWYGDITILFRYFVWRLTKRDVFAVRRIKRLK